MKKKIYYMITFLVFSLLFAPAVTGDHYQGTKNDLRFVGKWNIYRDGWKHSIWIKINPQYTPIKKGEPIPDPEVKENLEIIYYDQHWCKGTAWRTHGFGGIWGEKHNISFIIHGEDGKKSFFKGYIHNQSGSRMMAGFVTDQYGKFAWYGVKVGK